MKQPEIFKKIGVIIKELSEQYEYLQAADNHLNDLELELFVANANFLTDHVEILYKMNLQAPQRFLESSNPKGEEKYFEPVVQQVTYDTSAEEEKHESPEAVAEEPVAEEPIKEETHAVAELPQATETQEETEPVSTTEPTFDWGHQNHTPAPTEQIYPEQNLAIDTKREPENEVFTINDRVAEKIEPAVEPPLSDIKHGITLNDKLLFVKDLFNGYNLAYSEAVEILNRYHSFEDAQKFLNTNYVTKNNWNAKPETTAKFYAILKRRYA